MSQPTVRFVLLIVVSATLLASSTASGVGSVVEAVDAGNASSIKLSIDDQLRSHIGYVVGQDIRYAKKEAGAWAIETAYDDDAGLQRAALMTDASGQAHLLFVDTPYAKYGVRSGGTWQFETLTQPDENIVPDISLVVDEQGRPVVTYWMMQCGVDCDALLWQVDKATGAWAYGTAWVCLFVPGQTEIAVDGAGNRHGVVSCQFNNEVFCYGGEGFEFLPNMSGYEPFAFAVDSQGQPHIAYSWYSSLRHRFKDGGTWTDESIVLSAPELGESFSLALDAAGNPHVAYFDGVNDDLRYAHKEDGVWSFRVIDGEGIDVGSRTSIAVGSDGIARIAYLDRTNTALRYAVVSNYPTSIGSPSIRPDALTVTPNPSRGSVTVAFRLDASEPIRLSIYDVSGRLIRTLLEGRVGLGAQSIVWDQRSATGQDVGPGVYFARLESASSTETARMSVIR